MGKWNSYALATQHKNDVTDTQRVTSCKKHSQMKYIHIHISTDKLLLLFNNFRYVGVDVHITHHIGREVLNTWRKKFNMSGLTVRVCFGLTEMYLPAGTTHLLYATVHPLCKMLVLREMEATHEALIRLNSNTVWILKQSAYYNFWRVTRSGHKRVQNRAVKNCRNEQFLKRLFRLVSNSVQDGVIALLR